MPPGWIAGGNILIEGKPQTGLAVQIKNNIISAIAPISQATGEVRHLRPDQWLLPGLIDVQVNGGGGVLFNDAPEQLAVIVAAHAALGVASILPTLITDASDLMLRAASAVLNWRGDQVLGLHMEGPFISPARPGIHNPRFIRPMRPDDVAVMCGLAQRLAPRKLLVTLAPEEVPDDHLAALAAAGVIMAIGHTTASHERCLQALALGVRGFTHLWNAMPGPTARAPGPVVAALSQGYSGLIVDRVHVHRANLQLTLAAQPPGRQFLVSDAMSVAGTDQSEFMLQGQRIRRREGRLIGDDGTLAGADLDLRGAVQNAVDWLGLPFARAWSMGSEVPAQFLGLRDRGRIGIGCCGDLVVVERSNSKQ